MHLVYDDMHNGLTIEEAHLNQMKYIHLSQHQTYNKRI